MVPHEFELISGRGNEAVTKLSNLSFSILVVSASIFKIYTPKCQNTDMNFVINFLKSGHSFT